MPAHDYFADHESRCKDPQNCPLCRESEPWERFAILILAVTFVGVAIAFWIGLHGGIS